MTSARSADAVILFTRVPMARHTKTRLEPALAPSEIVRLHGTFLRAELKALLRSGAQVLVAFTPDFARARLRAHVGHTPAFSQGKGDIYARMRAAMRAAFARGYRRVVLVGSDVPELCTQHIRRAFSALAGCDAVYGPSEDGGYYLFGTTRPDLTLEAIAPAPKRDRRAECVLLEARLRALGCSVCALPALGDIDEAKDLEAYRLRVRMCRQEKAAGEIVRTVLGSGATVSFLAAGVYNDNYLVQRGSARALLRFKRGAQIGVSDPVAYEWSVLECLASSGVTPRPLAMVPRRLVGDTALGAFFEEYLPGRPLSYEEDLEAAARALAAIHSVEIPRGVLLEEPEPLEARIAEFERLIAPYARAGGRAMPFFRDLHALLLRRVSDGRYYRDHPVRALANTELNAANFVVFGGNVWVVDWEKAVVTDPSADPVQMLAPTTTLWRTNTVLSKGQIERFFRAYIAAGGTPDIRERVRIYAPYLLARALGWCAMAVTVIPEAERQRDPFTAGRMEMYLTDAFLETHILPRMREMSGG